LQDTAELLGRPAQLLLRVGACVRAAGVVLLAAEDRVAHRLVPGEHQLADAEARRRAHAEVEAEPRGTRDEDAVGHDEEGEGRTPTRKSPQSPPQ
jgi:hypothetical protein